MTDPGELLIRPMRVRPMQTGDIPRVIEIAGGLSDAPHWPVSAYVSALDLNAEPRRVALVAETMVLDERESRTVVGFAVASLVALEAEVESIAVAADARRLGIGSQLLCDLLVSLSELLVTRVNLEVRASNDPAIGLYKRRGFSETGRRIGYYADPVEDAVLLGLDLGGQKGG